MERATIGDDVRTPHEFEWEDGAARTTDELGDFEDAGLESSLGEGVNETPGPILYHI